MPEPMSAAELDAKMRELRALVGGDVGNNTVNIGAASAMSVFAAAFMAGALIVGVAWHLDSMAQVRQEMAELRQRDRVHEAYIQATYRGEKKQEK